MEVVMRVGPLHTESLFHTKFNNGGGPIYPKKLLRQMCE